MQSRQLPHATILALTLDHGTALGAAVAAGACGTAITIAATARMLASALLICTSDEMGCGLAENVVVHPKPTFRAA